MGKSSTRVKICVIAGANMVVVLLSSVFAVYGNGTPGGMFWVIGIGGAFVVWFAVRAFALAERGMDSEAVSVVSGTLLYAFAFALASTLAFGVLQYLWRTR